MAMPPFVTQAVNFVSSIAGGVDTRTGTYGITLNLGQISGNRGLGPVMPLTLRYSPLSNVNFGLGLGCTLGYSVYQEAGGGNEANRVLSLSTGEQYGVVDGGGRLQIPQMRLKSFKFWKDQNSYKVAHKNGDLEILNGNVPAAPYKLVSPSGHALTLTWDLSKTRARLTKVTDDDGTVLLDAEGNYTDSQAILSILPNDPKEGYKLIFNLGNPDAPILTKLTLTPNDGSPKQEWDFTVTDVGAIVQNKPLWGKRITGMTAPGGYSESVKYSQTNGYYPNEGFSFPHNSPYGNSQLPWVKEYNKIPGTSQTALKSTYTYSTDANFLGYGQSMTWQTYLDSLMTLPYNSNYAYWGQETQVSSQGSVITKRTYNAYHMQKSETISCNNNFRTTATTYDNLKPGYYVDDNTAHSQQPDNYQLQTATAVTWHIGANNGGTTETTYFEWDDFGNPIQRKDPSGLLTQWKYYDGSEQNNSQCPADPYGFTRYAEWTRVNPTGVNADVTGAPIVQTNYQYASRKPCSANSASVPYMVLKTAESHLSGGTLTNPGDDQAAGATLLSNATFAYFGGTGDSIGPVSDKDAGRVQCRTLLHYPKGEQSTPFKTDVQYDYSAVTGNDNGVLGVSIAQTSNAYDTDTLSITTTKVVSARTGRTWSTTDEKQNVTTFNYDGLGQLVKRTLNATNPQYTNVFNYTTSIAQADQTANHGGRVCGFQVVTTDTNNNSVCYTMDGLRRLVYTDVNSIDSGDPKKWYTSEGRTYDDLGRLNSVTASDYLPATGATYSLKKTIQYDDWGNSSVLSYANGTVETTVHDPIGKTTSVIVSGPKSSSGTYVTTYDYNYRQLALKTERYQLGSRVGVDQPYSRTSSKYNALGWVGSETEQQGDSSSQTFSTTSYGYDLWGRVVATTLPDSTIVQREYSPKSPAKHVSNIIVSSKSVGNRIFDGLGRVVSKTVGGRQWLYHYASSSYAQPDYAVAPDQVKRNYEYDDALGEVLRGVSTKQINHGYDYAPVTGLMKQAQATQDGGPGTITTKYESYASGRLWHQTSQHPGEGDKQVTYTYTVNGLRATVSQIDGSIQTIARDQYGTITTISDGVVEVTNLYDDKNWMTGWITKDLKTQHTLTTNINLDEFGRETGRTVQDDKSGSSWKTTLVLYANDLVKTCTYANGTTKAARIEQYRYDTRNRLFTWNGSQAGGASAPPLPSDRYGNTIISQQFQTDAYSNITSVVTGFANSKLTSPTNTTTFQYTNAKDPCLLVGGTNTNPAAGYPANFVVQYDDAGRILNDGMGTTFTYDELGRVATADATSVTGLTGSYFYNGHQQLSVQKVADSSLHLYYKGNQLDHLVQDNDGVQLYRSASLAPVAQYNTGTSPGVQLLGTNKLGSVLVSSDGQAAPKDRAYTAYGEEKIQKTST